MKDAAIAELSVRTEMKDILAYPVTSPIIRAEALLLGSGDINIVTSAAETMKRRGRECPSGERGLCECQHKIKQMLTMTGKSPRVIHPGYAHVTKLASRSLSKGSSR